MKRKNSKRKTTKVLSKDICHSSPRNICMTIFIPVYNVEVKEVRESKEISLPLVVCPK
jgi:hypothetical protein